MWRSTPKFKDIPGYEGLYGVSLDGTVISYARTITTKNGTIRRIKERIRSADTKWGRVTLSRNCVTHNYSSNTLVKMAWGELTPSPI